MIENIFFEEKILAIILRNKYTGTGIRFFTSDDFSQQLAYMNRPRGYIIAPHIHNLVLREVQFTNEVLYIKSGKIRVDFYDDKQKYLKLKIKILIKYIMFMNIIQLHYKHLYLKKIIF